MTTLARLTACMFVGLSILAGLSAILRVPFETTLAVTLVVEAVVWLTYGTVIVLRLSSQVGQSRPYHRPGIGEQQAQAGYVPRDVTIRVVGEVVEYSAPLYLRPHNGRRLSAPQRLALPAPKERHDPNPHLLR